MKKEVKKIITILKATPKLKLNIIASVVLFLLGMIGELLSYSNLSNMIFFTNSAIIFFMSIVNISGSGLAQSSPSAKKLQTVYPFFIQIPLYIITFLLISIHRLYIVSKPLPNLSLQESYAKHGTLILAFSVLCINFMLYEILFSKRTLLSIIFMVIIFIPTIIFTSMLDEFFKINMKSAIAIGFLIMIAGSLLSILVANLLYKYPVSYHVMAENNKA